MAGSVGAAGTAGAGQSQPTEVHADQPQRQGHDGPGSPVGDSAGGGVDGDTEVGSVEVDSGAGHNQSHMNSIPFFHNSSLLAKYHAVYKRRWYWIKLT